MTDQPFFDPRNDHTAREIRNQLARTFVKCLDTDKDLGPVTELAGQLLFKYPQDLYADYIRDRQHRYAAAKSIINTDKVTDEFQRALVLWDHELFFETHEILEALWKEATGSDKLILQAMIRAAGYFIQLASNNRVGAEKMAEKAAVVLRKYREEIPIISGLDRLLSCLEKGESTPPKLHG